MMDENLKMENMPTKSLNRKFVHASSNKTSELTARQ
jgi:hypothetical protein